MIKYFMRNLSQKIREIILSVSNYRRGDFSEENIENSDLMNYRKADDFWMGGYGKVEGKDAVIITVKKQWAEQKLFPSRNRINYYGIVDKDYDEKDTYIKKMW